MSLKHGFQLERSQEIAELRLTARIYRHVATGARLLSMQCDDDNKVFGISFRTPPKDSTGVAHILEHSVLCGSDKYPVKEPFVELLKGSLQTFLNAMTFPDKTCYPVASANLQDFYNLVDVYLDAVFHPRLTPQTLMQEGWHHEVEDGQLSYKGVVFNEMKGAYSSPDSLLAQRSQQSLFPDTTYGLDSGGEPAHIPDLTWETFEGFHRRYYHPSNAYTFFYGDDDEDRRLQILDTVFSDYQKQSVDSEVELQPQRAERVTVEQGYAADESGQAMFTLNFLLGPTAEPEGNLRWHVLEQVLIGLPSSPLRKALVDSDLGEDLCGIGLEDELRQMYFSVGLKGIERKRVDEAEALIRRTLQGLVDQGLNPADVEAALNSVEFDLRENNTGSFPRGLAHMFDALASWLYDGDPLALLPFEQPLAKLKQDLACGERVFEAMLQRDLLDNPHRSRVILVPDPVAAAHAEKQEQKRLAAERAAMNDAVLREVERQAQELKCAQEQADAPEALASIPRLSRADMPPQNKKIPCEQQRLAGRELLFHELPTRGIVYLDLVFDLGAVEPELLPLLGVFARALVESGTKQFSFVDLVRRIASTTGGIDPRLVITERRGQEQPVAKLLLRGKATRENAAALISLLRDITQNAKLDQKDRLRQIALESKARREQGLIPGGHQVVASRLRAHSGLAGALSERCQGIEALFALRRLLERMDGDFDSVARDMERLRGQVLRRNNLLLNLTAEAGDLAAIEGELPSLIEGLGAGPLVPMNIAPAAQPAREGLAIPAQVHYVGKGAAVGRLGYIGSGASQVVSRFLGTTYLWDQVRVQGGAYGAFCMYDRLAGHLGFVSYRDPNLDQTLAAFDCVADFLDANKPDSDALDKAIVGSIGEIDRYLLPDAKGFMSLMRHINGEDDVYRQQLRDQVLATTGQDFVDFAQAVRTVAREGQICVLGGELSLRASPAKLEVKNVL